MKITPTFYDPFEGHSSQPWPPTAGAVEVDSLVNLTAVKNRVTVNSIPLHALYFSGAYCWSVPGGWLDDRKPIPVAPGSLAR